MPPRAARIQGLTKTLAIELGRYGITCNAVAPGFIETDDAGDGRKHAWASALKNLQKADGFKMGQGRHRALVLREARQACVNGQVLCRWRPRI